MPKRDDIKKVLVIGSGPIVIGQAAEFDYSGSQACRALREEGIEVVLVNSNPATIMTDFEIADRVYIEPLVPEVVAEIIKKEEPDGILPTLGGQTGLNMAVALDRMGVLDEYGVECLGTPISAIETAEDRELFRKAMEEIGERIPRSKAAYSVEEAKEIAENLGYPVVIRPAYTLGGTGGGIARNERELEEIVRRGLTASMIHQVLVEECIYGWKEYEYEVMRDSANNCITVCNMENVDPMGIHTGESIVVAPAQTLSEYDHQRLRTAALKIIRHLGVEGGCNIQFALHPETGEYMVIEVNPRVSRSSALASKATGYPIARVAAKIAIGYTLDEIPNRVVGGRTPASFEPALDYVVVKIPRWPFDKFRTADRTLGTQMKSTGETMAIGRTFEEALQKAIRSLDIGRWGLGADGKDKDYGDLDNVRRLLATPTDERIFVIRYALLKGMSVEEISDLTKIDPWFIRKIKNIVDMERELSKHTLDTPGIERLIRKAKRLGFSDRQIAYLLGATEEEVREFRKRKGIVPVYKMVDTCAAEFEAETPYYYSTYEDQDEARVPEDGEKRTIVIIGGGPIRIGQGIEFDYCTVHAVVSLKEEGYDVVVINNNPETVSTDFDTSDRLYFEPLTFEDVMNVIERERPLGVIVQFGGQTPLNITVPLARSGVRILGTPPESIDIAEDREKWASLLRKLGIKMPPFGIARSVEEALEIARKLGYPVLVRPSYVLGGRAMEIVWSDEELMDYMREAIEVSPEHPVLIDKFLDDAIEVDVDALCDGEDVYIGGILEHIERAGVHSGDSAMVLPPQSLGEDVLEKIRDYTERIALALGVVGLINIQFAVKDGEVYVLEGNPRASRTVPFISKATGIPLAKIAAKLMIGYKLRDFGLVGDGSRIGHVAVKESVFSFEKLPGVDPVLGPEMKSTGEVMGIDYDFGKAFFKAQLAAGNPLPVPGRVYTEITGRPLTTARSMRIFVSASRDYRREVIEIARGFAELGFRIVATEGTARDLLEAGLEGVEIIRKVSEGYPNIIDYMRERRIDLVINIPGRRPEHNIDDYKIRRAAVEMKIPYITTVAAARAALDAIRSVMEEKITVRELREYLGGRWLWVGKKLS